MNEVQILICRILSGIDGGGREVEGLRDGEQVGRGGEGEAREVRREPAVEVGDGRDDEELSLEDDEEREREAVERVEPFEQEKVEQPQPHRKRQGVEEHRLEPAEAHLLGVQLQRARQMMLELREELLQQAVKKHELECQLLPAAREEAPVRAGARVLGEEQVRDGVGGGGVHEVQAGAEEDGEGGAVGDVRVVDGEEAEELLGEELAAVGEEEEGGGVEEVAAEGGDGGEVLAGVGAEELGLDGGEGGAQDALEDGDVPFEGWGR